MREVKNIETMITYYNNILCVSYDELVDKDAKPNEIKCGVMTYYQFKAHKRSGKISEVRRACRGRIALYDYESLPSFIQDALKLKYPQGIHKAASASEIERFLENDIHAYHFYDNYRLANGNKLSDKTIRTYTANATVMNAIVRLLNDKQAYRKALGGTKLGSGTLSSIINSLQPLKEKWGFKLPKSERSIRRLLNLYKSVSYEALISKKHGNSNAGKIVEDEQVATLRRILANWRNLDNAQVAKMYNMVAEQAGWKNITAATVGNRREEWQIFVDAGARGEKHHDNMHGMQVKRRLPSIPLAYWTLDGWDVELLYQKQTTDKRGKTVTTYHNRLNAVIVLDPATNYPIGYAIADLESPISIKAAIRNALMHVQELFGAYYYPHQIQSDNYGRGAMKPLYEAVSEYYTPAKVGNAKSKIIEPRFKQWNKDFCQMQHNWSGFGVTARKENQPNGEWLNKTIVKHNFPDRAGCVAQIERMIFMKRQAAIEAYRAAWTNTPEDKKLAWTTADFLYHVGETTGFTNRLEGSGLHFTLNKVKRTYDSFDQQFRMHRNQDWIVKYNPDDFERILVQDAEGKLRFLLEEKYEQPMALIDREDGDYEALQKVFAFNKETKAEILAVQDKDFEVLEDLYDNYPALNDTLGKFLITDSKGQHKDQKSHARLMEAAGKIEIKQVRKQAQEEKEAIRMRREAYLDDKIDFENFYSDL